ncbi:DUF4037 domain-containing protein [Devosia sp. FKR38]|uniref:DUF4037 domain-containing protein n=1 Tax=Devosia sp. FKR38 TaxID=2562312 RepID=UPI0020C0D719|nr:DUF4037 domain-containing protein [Devosia sp. FKR38]
MTRAPGGATLLNEVDLIADVAPIIADLADGGRGAVALAGSRGKGRSDQQSDYDFRVYADGYRGEDTRQTPQWARFEAAMTRWQAAGFRMDGVWMRSYAGVRRDLDAWLVGTAVPKTFDWTIWGYHLPTDLANQQIVLDPDGLLAGWKRELAVYPEPLRLATLQHYGQVLRYWAGDYHYESKVARRDLVFLVGLAGKLTNAMIQVLFAHNRQYYPGDGWNLPMAAELDQLPPDFVARMTAILEPAPGEDAWRQQRAQIIAMITDIEALIAS